MGTMTWSMRAAVVVWLTGCAPEAPIEPPGPRGAPVQPAADPLDSLPPCEPLEPDGRVDLREGCVDGGCAWMSAGELEPVWGRASCARSSSTPTVLCAWASGVWAAFDDRDDNGLPDRDVPARLLFLDPPFDGATLDGLGVGASLSCFVDVLGPPDAVDLTDEGAGWVVRSMAWSVDGVAVYDHRGEGRAATVSVAGAE